MALRSAAVLGVAAGDDGDGGVPCMMIASVLFLAICGYCNKRCWLSQEVELWEAREITRATTDGLHQGDRKGPRPSTSSIPALTMDVNPVVGCHYDSL